MKKHLVIWIIATFIITVFASAVLNRILPPGIMRTAVIVGLFCGIGYFLFDPIERKFGD